MLVDILKSKGFKTLSYKVNRIIKASLKDFSLDELIFEWINEDSKYSFKELGTEIEKRQIPPQLKKSPITLYRFLTIKKSIFTCNKLIKFRTQVYTSWTKQLKVAQDLIFDREPQKNEIAIIIKKTFPETQILLNIDKALHSSKFLKEEAPDYAFDEKEIIVKILGQLTAEPKELQVFDPELDTELDIGWISGRKYCSSYPEKIRKRKEKEAKNSKKLLDSWLPLIKDFLKYFNIQVNNIKIEKNIITIYSNSSKEYLQKAAKAFNRVFKKIRNSNLDYFSRVGEVFNSLPFKISEGKWRLDFTIDPDYDFTTTAKQILEQKLYK